MNISKSDLSFWSIPILVCSIGAYTKAYWGSFGIEVHEILDSPMAFQLLFDSYILIGVFFLVLTFFSFYSKTEEFDLAKPRFIIFPLQIFVLGIIFWWQDKNEYSVFFRYSLSVLVVWFVIRIVKKIGIVKSELHLTMLAGAAMLIVISYSLGNFKAEEVFLNKNQKVIENIEIRADDGVLLLKSEPKNYILLGGNSDKYFFRNKSTGEIIMIRSDNVISITYK